MTKLYAATLFMAALPGALPATAAPLCLDAAPGEVTVPHIERLFGRGAVESPSDAVYSPPRPHILQLPGDAAVGPHFAFIAIEPTDVNLDGKPRSAGGDRSRTEIKLAPAPGGPQDSYRGHEGDTLTYTWRFRIGEGMRFSPSFTHIHQIKAYGGEFSDPPLITFTPLANGTMEVRHVGDRLREARHAALGAMPLTNEWLSVRETITYSNSAGRYRLSISDAAGVERLSIDRSGLQLWRTGADHMRPKWGIYRKHHPALNQRREDTVYFANFCIARGDAP